jgi:hypothetical protein
MVVQYAESEYVILDDTIWHGRKMAILTLPKMESFVMVWLIKLIGIVAI